MKILGVHNYYGDYGFGGEANVFEKEMKLLSDHGHEIEIYTCTNYDLYNYPIRQKIYTLINSHWNNNAYKIIRDLLTHIKPDIMHVHNTWFLLTPSIFQAAHELNIPSVITLHNYRLACPAGQFLLNGNECNKCLGMNKPWPLLLNRCYNSSYAQSILRYRLYTKARQNNIWSNKVGSIIALTEFAANKFASSGIPIDKITVKPNCIDDPVTCLKTTTDNRYGAVFIGRLSEEKGVQDLIKAWTNIDYPLTVIGDGPLKNKLQEIASSKIRFTGYLEPNEIITTLQKSAFLLFPSECYEGFPMTILESMACGTPIIATRYGAMNSILKDNHNALLFNKGEISDMQNVIRHLINSPELQKQLGSNARKEYLDKYTSNHNYQYLMNIYNSLINHTHMQPLIKT